MPYNSKSSCYASVNICFVHILCFSICLCVMCQAVCWVVFQCCSRDLLNRGVELCVMNWQEDSESAPLHLGGFRVHCSDGAVQQIQSVRSRGRGRGQKVLIACCCSPFQQCHSSHTRVGQLQGRQSTQRPHMHADEDDSGSDSTDDSSLDSDEVADYLANLEPHSADSNSAEEQVGLNTKSSSKHTLSHLHMITPSSIFVVSHLHLMPRGAHSESERILRLGL